MGGKKSKRNKRRKQKQKEVWCNLHKKEQHLWVLETLFWWTTKKKIAFSFWASLSVCLRVWLWLFAWIVGCNCWLGLLVVAHCLGCWLWLLALAVCCGCDRECCLRTISFILSWLVATVACCSICITQLTDFHQCRKTDQRIDRQADRKRRWNRQRKTDT